MREGGLGRRGRARRVGGRAGGQHRDCRVLLLGRMVVDWKSFRKRGQRGWVGTQIDVLRGKRCLRGVEGGRGGGRSLRIVSGWNSYQRWGCGGKDDRNVRGMVFVYRRNYCRTKCSHHRRRRDYVPNVRA